MKGYFEKLKLLYNLIYHISSCIAKVIDLEKLVSLRKIYSSFRTRFFFGYFLNISSWKKQGPTQTF
jgi:hypothetical protein